MEDSSFWAGIAGLGIIWLYIRLVLSMFRIEKYAKLVADYFKEKRELEERERQIRSFTSAAGLVQK